MTGVKLHTYQISAINWMATTEQDVGKSKFKSTLHDVNKTVRF